MKIASGILTIAIIVSIAADSQKSNAQTGEIPSRVIEIFKSSGLDKRYEFSSKLTPSFLQGDFDGDGKPDTAAIVKQKINGKIGIAICHSSTHKILLIGGGTTIGNGGDNFDWMDIWKVVPKASAAKQLGRAAATLKGDALHVEKNESASALVYWNGARYVWRQQGD